MSMTPRHHPQNAANGSGSLFAPHSSKTSITQNLRTLLLFLTPWTGYPKSIAVKDSWMVLQYNSL